MNEDANSSLYVISPRDEAADQVRHYTYSPDPAALSGGGTDAVTIHDGAIYVSASNPSPDPNGSTFSKPALFRLTVPEHGSVAQLRPVFADNAQAADGNAGAKGTTTLNLSDPDSNAQVSASSPRFANDLVLDSQGNSQLVFASDPGGASQALTLLDLGGPQVDDVRWTTTRGGTLYVVDQKADQIWAISGPFPAGAAYAAIPGDSAALGGDLGRVNLSSGNIQAFASGFISPKGLLYVPAQTDGDDSQGNEGSQGNQDSQGNEGSQG